MHWILKRALRSLFTFVLVVNLSFVMIRQLPGGPVDYLISQLYSSGAQVDEEEITALARAYVNVDPNQSLWAQYVDYMTSLLRGDLGTSILYGDPVTGMLWEALPWTIFVLSIATLLLYLIGIALGAVMAYLEGSRFDTASTIVSIVVNSIPYYVFALIALYLLGYQFGVFPLGGKMNTNTTPGFNLPFLIGVFQHAALPIISVVVTGFGGLALGMRGNSIQVLGSDFLRVARLRGLSTRRIATRYVARNAILPIYTGMLIRLGGIFGGSVILERIFVYRGLGYYLFKAIEARDYPLMMGAFLLITFAVITAVFVAELTYGKIDPRAQEGGRSA